MFSLIIIDLRALIKILTSLQRHVSSRDRRPLTMINKTYTICILSYVTPSSVSKECSLSGKVVVAEHADDNAINVVVTLYIARPSVLILCLHVVTDIIGNFYSLQLSYLRCHYYKATNYRSCKHKFSVAYYKVCSISSR